MAYFLDANAFIAARICTTGSTFVPLSGTG